MPKKVLLDCPYCHNCDDVEVSLGEPLHVGPFKHKCSDCKRDFIYTIAVEIEAKCNEIQQESDFWLREKKGSEDPHESGQ